MSTMLWITHWSDSPLGLVVFFVLTSAVLSTGAYVRPSRRRAWSTPTRVGRRGDF